MGEYNFCDDLKNIMYVKELNSKTLRYRLNGFVYACQMDIQDGDYTIKINSKDFSFTIKRKEDNYSIKIGMMDTYLNKYNRVFKISGDYNGLEFEFINKYNNSINNNWIKNIPFNVFLKKNDLGLEYQLTIESINYNRVLFSLQKCNDKESELYQFYACITDFSKILKLIKSFVSCPHMVYDIYQDIIRNSMVILTNADLSMAYDNDEKLNQPVSKLIKKIKLLDD